MSTLGAARAAPGLGGTSRRLRSATFVLCFLLLPGAFWSQPTAPQASFTVLRQFPHERACFTEGFFLNGSAHEVLESCGLYGQSYIKRYVLETGQVLHKEKIEAKIFAEGFARLGGRLFLLTYHEKHVLEFDESSWQERRRHPFPYGEGWGLTTDGCDLLATTGDSYIYRLRFDGSGTLQLASKVQVKNGGRAVRNLNELEYVTPKIWVHEWFKNYIHRVDPATGTVEMFIDIRKLYSWRGGATPNGVAHSVYLDPSALLVTGKNWPQSFLLQLSPVDLCGGVLSAEPAKPAGAGTCLETAPLSGCWNQQGSVGAATTGSSNALPPTVSAVATTATAAPVGDAEKPPLTGSSSFAVLSLAILLALATLVVPLFRGIRYSPLPQNPRRDIATVETGAPASDSTPTSRSQAGGKPTPDALGTSYA